MLPPSTSVGPKVPPTLKNPVNSEVTIPATTRTDHSFTASQPGSALLDEPLNGGLHASPAGGRFSARSMVDGEERVYQHLLRFGPVRPVPGEGNANANDGRSRRLRDRQRVFRRPVTLVPGRRCGPGAGWGPWQSCAA
jgi:hypothetical protein